MRDGRTKWCCLITVFEKTLLNLNRDFLIELSVVAGRRFLYRPLLVGSSITLSPSFSHYFKNLKLESFLSDFAQLLLGVDVILTSVL